MNGITHWIKQHQVVAFFIVAYIIAWPVLFLVYFVFPGNQLMKGKKP